MRCALAFVALVAAPAAAQGVGVHFIEQVGPSVRMTTLTGFEPWQVD